jgi:hypothetical protein
MAGGGVGSWCTKKMTMHPFCRHSKQSRLLGKLSKSYHHTCKRQKQETALHDFHAAFCSNRNACTLAPTVATAIFSMVAVASRGIWSSQEIPMHFVPSLKKVQAARQIEQKLQRAASGRNRNAALYDFQAASCSHLNAASPHGKENWL